MAAVFGAGGRARKGHAGRYVQTPTPGAVGPGRSASSLFIVESRPGAACQAEPERDAAQRVGRLANMPTMTPMNTMPSTVIAAAITRITTVAVPSSRRCHSGWAV